MSHVGIIEPMKLGEESELVKRYKTQLEPEADPVLPVMSAATCSVRQIFLAWEGDFHPPKHHIGGGQIPHHVQCLGVGLYPPPYAEFCRWGLSHRMRRLAGGILYHPPI